jgi:hypothetical protein
VIVDVCLLVFCLWRLVVLDRNGVLFSSRLLWPGVGFVLIDTLPRPVSLYTYDTYTYVPITLSLHTTSNTYIPIATPSTPTIPLRL